MIPIFDHLLFSLFVTGLLNLNPNCWPQGSYAGSINFKSWLWW